MFVPQLVRRPAQVETEMQGHGWSMQSHAPPFSFSHFSELVPRSFSTRVQGEILPKCTVCPPIQLGGGSRSCPMIPDLNRGCSGTTNTKVRVQHHSAGIVHARSVEILIIGINARI